MKWQQDFYDGMVYLNQYFLETKFEETSIFIHYWGAEEDFKSNNLHQHSFFEICYVINGEGIYMNNEDSISLKEGTLFLSAPYQKHQIFNVNDLSMLFIGFELVDTNSTKIKDLFNHTFIDLIHITKDFNVSASIHLWFALYKLAAQETDNRINKDLNPLIIMLICNLIENFHKDKNKSQKIKNKTSASEIIYQAKVYINENLEQNFVLSDVSNYIHISERHLSRLFRQEMGQTFSSYVKKERIRKAGIKLAETNIPIKDIAENVGFSNVHYFSKVFSEEMDMPPGKFRNKFQLNIKEPQKY